MKLFDHENLTYKRFNTERVMRWRLILKESIPELIYIKGSKNIVADAFSCWDLINNVNNLYNNKVKPTLESLSENISLKEEDVFHPTGFKTIMRSQ